LDSILEQKAKEGVKIYVLLWAEHHEAFINNFSTQTKQVQIVTIYYDKLQFLEKLHPNIRVLRHPKSIEFRIQFWSHHQKIVCVDQKIAFLGGKLTFNNINIKLKGLDFCIGRYDDSEHRFSLCLLLMNIQIDRYWG
jgi:phospholipase D1/2